MDFENYEKQHNHISGDSIYADCVNHCRSYKQMWVRGDKNATAHECSHGIHAELRNAQSFSFRAPTFDHNGVEILDIVLSDEHIAHAAGLGHQCRLIQPNLEYVRPITGQGINAFYIPKNQYIVLKEPGIRKSSAIKFLPKELREYRYGTYVSGQKAWDGQPLYIFDEWNAYCNGDESALDMAEKGTWDEGFNSDCGLGIVEFVIYSTAIMMSAHRSDNNLDEKLIPFFRWNVNRSMNLVFRIQKFWPWDGREKLYNRLKSDSVGSDMRTFLKDVIKYDLPSKLEDTLEVPEPKPDAEIDFNAF